MTLIAELFNTTVTIIDRLHTGRSRELAYLVRTVKYQSNYAMLSYLLQYPLFTYKYNSPPVYALILQLSESKAHKNSNGNNMLTELKVLSKQHPQYTLQQHIDRYFYKL